LPDRPKYFDATDALAVAVCHHFQDKVPTIKCRMFKKKKSSWQEFIDINQHRVKS
ncbi:MAG: crossover junction endodeoxyribonuclease RuvC, partial [Flavisolibacter sp.]|nr:crossover junction endodeoxyribonuclease RuvC [Flavisolibacter sp.]